MSNHYQSVLGFFMLYFVICSPVLADAGWTGYGNIIDLTVNGKGRITLELSVSENDTNCRNKQKFYHIINDRGSNYIFELLAKAAVNNIKIRVYQTSVCDLNNYSNIYAVGLQP